MAFGNEIIVSSQPRGVFKEGIISGTPLPGTLMQIKETTERSSGAYTFEAYAPGTDGERPQGALWVLDYDKLQGRTVNDAYAAGDYARLYCPAPGEEMNVRVSAAGTGTGDAIAIGQKLIPDTGTGLLVATTGSPEIEPYISLETVSDVVSTGTLVHCMATGY